MSAVGLAACGIIAPIIYVGTVALGGFWRPDYSHRSRAISELTEREAPNKRTLDGLFLIYNLFALLGAIGIYLATYYMGGNFHSGAALLVTEVVLSFFMTVFPMDPLSRENSIPGTPGGRIHVAAAFLVVFFIIICLGLYANAGINTYRFYGWGVFTAVSLAVIILAGITSVVMAARLHPYMGLAERLTIGMYQVWFFITCCLVASYYFPS